MATRVGGARVRAGARGGCVVIARAIGGRGARRARARGRGRGRGRSYPKRVLRGARDGRETRETDGDSYAL